MKVKIDKKSNAAYITLLNRRIKPGEAVHTFCCNHLNVYLDVDKKGRILGVELLDLRHLHPDSGGSRSSRKKSP